MRLFRFGHRREYKIAPRLPPRLLFPGRRFKGIVIYSKRQFHVNPLTFHKQVVCLKQDYSNAGGAAGTCTGCNRTRKKKERKKKQGIEKNFVKNSYEFLRWFFTSRALPGHISHRSMILPHFDFLSASSFHLSNFLTCWSLEIHLCHFSLLFLRAMINFESPLQKYQWHVTCSTHLWSLTSIHSNFKSLCFEMLSQKRF